jgi:hypothetical protein
MLIARLKFLLDAETNTHFDDRGVKMKTSVFFLVFLSYSICFADIKPKDSHLLNKCVKIVNIEEFPELVLIQYVIGMGGKRWASLISDKCLDKGYKFNGFRIYALNKSYFDQFPTLEEIPFKDNNNFITLNPFGGWISNSNHLSGLIQEYKILGLENDKLNLYLYRETKKYNDGTHDQVNVFPKPTAK